MSVKISKFPNIDDALSEPTLHRDPNYRLFELRIRVSRKNICFVLLNTPSARAAERLLYSNFTPNVWKNKVRI